MQEYSKKCSKKQCKNHKTQFFFEAPCTQLKFAQKSTQESAQKSTQVIFAQKSTKKSAQKSTQSKFAQKSTFLILFWAKKC